MYDRNLLQVKERGEGMVTVVIVTWCHCMMCERLVWSVVIWSVSGNRSMSRMPWSWNEFSSSTNPNQ